MSSLAGVVDWPSTGGSATSQANYMRLYAGEAPIGKLRPLRTASFLPCGLYVKRHVDLPSLFLLMATSLHLPSSPPLSGAS